MFNLTPWPLLHDSCMTKTSIDIEMQGPFYYSWSYYQVDPTEKQDYNYHDRDVQSDFTRASIVRQSAALLTYYWLLY